MVASKRLDSDSNLMTASNPQISGLKPDLKPWQRVDWNSCVQSRLYGDWGQYYARRLLNKKALECYGRALAICKDIDPSVPSSCMKPSHAATREVRTCYQEATKTCEKDYELLTKISKCHRDLTDANSALIASTLARKIVEERNSERTRDRTSVVLEECAGLYDANRFEETLTYLNIEKANAASALMAKEFNLRRELTLITLNDTVGESMSSFICDNIESFHQAAKHHKDKAEYTPRPLWKVLQEQNRCDVQSILSKELAVVTPLERARRRVWNNVFNYQYLGKSAHDVSMLRALRSNQDFLNPLLHESTGYLRDFTNDQYRIVRRFMKMMHARNPLYNKNFHKCRGTSICEKNRENYLYRVEYQTRRDCFRILRELRQRRRERNIEKLTDYVNDIMGNYITLKTHRTLPWKFEFINDVYNTVALAHLDRYSVPNNVNLLDPRSRSVLYMMPLDRVKDVNKEFGGPNVYIEIAREEEHHNRMNKRIDTLEERLQHSHFAIERAFLLFEIARLHLKESRFDKCLLLARRAIHEARNCNSAAWRFNSIFLVCQVHASLNRLERLKESLNKAATIAQELKSTRLTAYVNICRVINDYELAGRSNRPALDLSMRRRSRRRASVVTLSSSTIFNVNS